MSMSDPLADMLTRIRNAVMVNLTDVDMPYSKIKAEIARILKEEGYVKDFQKIAENSVQGTLRITLKRNKDSEKVITGLKRVSKPGRRIYARHDEIPKVLSGLGISIVSTSQGLLTDHDARDKNIGGEILCEVW